MKLAPQNHFRRLAASSLPHQHPASELSSFVFNALQPLFPKHPGGWGIKPPASSFELPEPRIKMTYKSPSSDFTPERCQHRTPTGRQCCSLVVDPNSSFCPRHAASEPADSEDFSVALTQKPAASRMRRASTIPSQPSTHFWPEAAFRPAAPPCSPTSAACSSARCPQSTPISTHAPAALA